MSDQPVRPALDDNSLEATLARLTATGDSVLVLFTMPNGDSDKAGPMAPEVAGPMIATLRKLGCTVSLARVNR